MLSQKTRDRIHVHAGALASFIAAPDHQIAAKVLDKVDPDFHVLLADLARRHRSAAPEAYRAHIDNIASQRGKKQKRNALIAAVHAHGGGFLDFLKSAANKAIGVGKAGVDVVKSALGFAKNPTGEDKSKKTQEYKGQEGLDRLRSDVKKNESSLASLFGSL